MNENVKKFKVYCDIMADTYERKNADYGDSFGQSMDEFGMVVGVSRMSDKLNRIKSVIKSNSAQVNESLEDTLLDLACYSIMTLVWLNQHNNEDK